MHRRRPACDFQAPALQAPRASGARRYRPIRSPGSYRGSAPWPPGAPNLQAIEQLDQNQPRGIVIIIPGRGVQAGRQLDEGFLADPPEVVLRHLHGVLQRQSPLRLDRTQQLFDHLRPIQDQGHGQAIVQENVGRFSTLAAKQLPLQSRQRDKRAVSQPGQQVRPGRLEIFRNSRSSERGEIALDDTRAICRRRARVAR